MSDVVFILGAGASADAGTPVMGNFLEEAQKLLITKKLGSDKIHFERVFKAISKLQIVHSKANIDLNNIESIFTAFELSKIIGNIPIFDTDHKLNELIESLKLLIVKTLEHTTNFDSQHLAKDEDSDITPLGSYSKFVSLIEEIPKIRYISSTSVITFNYDVALDLSFIANDTAPDYCLDSLNPSSEELLESIKLLKLHGSLNWLHDGDRSGPVILDLTKVKFKKMTPLRRFHRNALLYRASIPSSKEKIGIDLQVPKTSSALLNFPVSDLAKKYVTSELNLDGESLHPFIVPPTWNKSDYHAAISKVWSAAAQELLKAQYIFIIGYSLPETDAFFKLLFGLGSAGDTIIKKIVVYNPDSSGEVENRFRGILGTDTLKKMDYKQMKFADAIDDIHTFFLIIRTTVPSNKN